MRYLLKRRKNILKENNDLERPKLISVQKKDRLTLKQLSSINTKVLLEEKTKHVLEVVFKNKGKNKELTHLILIKETTKVNLFFKKGMSFVFDKET